VSAGQPTARSTPELDQVRAHLCAFVPYCVAAGVLEQLLPVDAGVDPETLRACTLKVGADLVDTAATDPTVAASAITLILDSTSHDGASVNYVQTFLSLCSV
jgi:hypothetical protein